MYNDMPELFLSGLLCKIIEKIQTIKFIINR